MKSSGGKSRGGAVRKGRKGAQVGSGGNGRRALEGKGPTPKAEDREYHVAHKAKVLRERAAAKQAGRGGRDAAPRGASGAARRAKSGDESEIVTGRNSVLEALRARIPATTLYIAARVEMDDRMKEILSIATGRGIPVLEIMRPELDRLAGRDAVHQGVALKVPPYEYAHPGELLDLTLRKVRRRCSWPSTASPTRATSARSSARPPRSAARASSCRSAGRSA